jgi:D-alanyl-D-alanine carboxypeptidase/D-alanyl-D-alanine-endopeptidase (penicillin-binding protein 4)
LKVSQNLHASITPFVIGAVIGHATDKIDASGFGLEKEMLTKAGLDVSGASQSDGAGGAQGAFYTPEFMVRYLAFMSRQADFATFHRALPILGKDGTLVDIQKESAGAGHVFAKTGTFGAPDLLNATSMLTGKGLAGYFTTKAGRPMAFAFFINHVEVQGDQSASSVAGQALGELASAAYDLPIGASAVPEVGPK